MSPCSLDSWRKARRSILRPSGACWLTKVETCSLSSIFIAGFVEDGERVVFGLARFRIADGLHGFGVGEDFHGFEDGLEAFGGKQVADDFVAAGDNDGVFGGLANHGGKVGLGFGDGIRSGHKILRRTNGVKNQLRRLFMVWAAYLRAVSHFPATREFALQRLEEFLGRAPRYAAERNHVVPGHENVTRLSAALSHRLITEREVVEAALQSHSFRAVEKFLQEVMWRGYWKGWLEWRPMVWDRHVAAVRKLEERQTIEEREACAQVEEGRSASGIMNYFARELVETGYLHNHARMWWASYWIHHAGLPWVLGAKFFMDHLLDADAASNTLSWRWVAGLQTKGKTYLATEQNIRKFCAPEAVERAGGVGFPEGVIARPVEDEENSELLELSGKHVPSECPASVGERRLGMVLHDEDMSLETGPLAGLKPALLLQFVAGKTEVASPRGRWLEGARADAAGRTRAHFGCEVRMCHGIDELVSVAIQANIEELVMMQPFVGSLRDAMGDLSSKLQKTGIRFTALARPWDHALRPYAQRGFFPYWNSVGRKLSKHGAEGIA